MIDLLKHSFILNYKHSVVLYNHISVIGSGQPAVSNHFFLTESGTTHIYVECSTAGPSHISHYGAMPAGWSPILICHVLLLFLLSIPDMIILMLSNFNSSQKLEFDDFWKLLAASLLQVSSKMKNLFASFLSLFLVLGRFFLLLIMAF